MKANILIVDDEQSMADLLEIFLKNDDYTVYKFYNGQDALKCVEETEIDLAILDVMLPGIDGYEVCRTLRAEGYEGGIIMLTARVQESDKVTGLMTGADDYVTKPFSVAELTARVDALVRRLGFRNASSEVIQSGPFCLDLRARELRKNDHRVDLTQVEFALMKAFM